MAITQVSNSLVKQDLTISGGTVDNTVIGSGTPAAGTFTTIAGTLASTVTGTTAAASDNSTKVATTAYVTTALANLVDSAPGTLNTLNELAAALGDDASFSTTVTNSIATKLPLAGGTMTGAIAHSGNFSIDAAGDIHLDADSEAIRIRHDGGDIGIIQMTSNDLILRSMVSDKDLIFKGNDGGSVITALTLDMSNAGIATFNSGINIGNRGSATDPTLQSSIDPDTGVYWGGSNILGFTTGGSERLRITAGKVSIGTTAVASATSASLHVADPGVDVQAVFGDNLASIDDPQIRVIGRDSANSAIRYLFTGLDADANHGFIGYNAGAGAFQNALTFDTSGKVGIGTTSPAQLLHVSGGASASTSVRFGQNYDTSVEIGPVSATASGMLKFLNASGTSKVSMGFRDSGSGTDGAFRIRRGATLDSSGSFINFGTDGTVQIEKSNVSNPHVDTFAALIVEDAEARLQLISNDSGDEASTLLLTNVNKHWGINNHGPDQSNRFGIGYYASSSSGIDIASNLSDALSIGTNGYVGLGTTTLNKFFNLVDPAQGGEQIKLHFEASSGADLWSIYSYDRVNSHYTNMLLGQYTYIKSGGEVSIGNINGDFRVNQKLGVVGAGVRGGISVSSYINAATSAVFDFNKSRHASPGNHTVVQEGDALGVLIWRGDDGDEFVDGAAISANVDNTPGNGDMPARLEFFTSPDGTGGMREVMRIDSKANLLLGDGVTANGSLGTKYTDTSGFQIGKPGVDNRSGIIMMEQYAYQNTWITFLDVHNVGATGVTFLLNATRLADQNRHCTRLVRYAYNQTFTAITTSQQNTSIEFRVSSGSLQYRFTSAGTYGVSIIVMAGG